MDFLTGLGSKIIYVYDEVEKRGDPRVENWPLAGSPMPMLCIITGYLLMVWLGPKAMANREAMQLKQVLVVYNFLLVGLSIYMFYEFRVTSWLASYSYKCQPVDYSNSVLGMRMARVCWWFFFSKVIETLDTLFFIFRKKNSQITFLHVYHHSSMMVNWYLGVKLIAGGQSFFCAMLNSFVHIFMYTYYGLAALGPKMQKYLWWKRYITKIQLIQFLAIIIHTGYNLTTNCDFPQGFNYAVFLYCITMIILFSNFFVKAYTPTKKEKQKL